MERWRHFGAKHAVNLGWKFIRDKKRFLKQNRCFRKSKNWQKDRRCKNDRGNNCKIDHDTNSGNL